MAHSYEGRDEDPTTHGGFVIPAGLVMPLVVDVRPTSVRTPARVYGPNGSHTIVDGECPSTYIELCLDPLGAYTLFGPAVADIGESIVGLEDLVGADARRLAERIQSAPESARQACVLDTFLLERGARGPEPSSEVERGVGAARAVGRDEQDRRDRP